MKILFYQNSVQKDKIVSDIVHIVEVLNGLTKQGHTVRYADGKYHSLLMQAPAGDASRVSRVKLSWEKVKKSMWALPFRGEALLGYYFMKEILLFFIAFQTVWSYRPDVIYRRHALFSSEYLLSRIFKIPCIIEVNGLIGDEQEVGKKGDKISLWMTNTIEKYSFGKADKYITVTAKLKDTLTGDYHVPGSRVAVIENGANTDLFKPMDPVIVKKELDLEPQLRFICFVGGLAIYHGVNYLISALPSVLKEFPEARALVVGESRSEAELTKSKLVSLSRRLGVVDKVTFTGRVPYEKVPSYVNASEICVIPAWWPRSKQRTGFSSLKLCEYLACGKPVVASRISGFDFIEEQDCGYLVDPNSAEELAAAIISLLRDPVNERRMGENGRKFVLKNRSWEAVTKRVISVCENTIEENIKQR